MREYIPFTEEQKRQANEVDLVAFLRQRGEKLLPSGRNKRLESNHSVTVRGNRWYDHATEEGGFPVEFVRRYLQKSYPEAVSLLLESDGISPRLFVTEPEPLVKPFELPPAADHMRRVFAYLLGARKIDRDVLQAFVREKLIYEDAAYHNAVFVGLDEKGVPRHAHKRSTSTYGRTVKLSVEGSNPACSFHRIGKGKNLYVFEAPIDLLSFVSLYPLGWKEHSYVALCGLSEHALVKTLADHPHLTDVILCLDNDEAGQKGTDRLTDVLHQRGNWNVGILTSNLKDWNDDLKERFAPIQREADGGEPMERGMRIEP